MYISITTPIISYNKDKLQHGIGAHHLKVSYTGDKHSYESDHVKVKMTDLNDMGALYTTDTEFVY